MTFKQELIRPNSSDMSIVRRFATEVSYDRKFDNVVLEAFKGTLRPVLCLPHPRAGKNWYLMCFFPASDRAILDDYFAVGEVFTSFALGETRRACSWFSLQHDWSVPFYAETVPDCLRCYWTDNGPNEHAVYELASLVTDALHHWFYVSKWDAAPSHLFSSLVTLCTQTAVRMCKPDLPDYFGFMTCRDDQERSTWFHEYLRSTVYNYHIGSHIDYDGPFTRLGYEHVKSNSEPYLVRRLGLIFNGGHYNSVGGNV